MVSNIKSILEISKTFPVDEKKLFQAWVTPDEIKKWWTPLNSHLKDVNIELKENGKLKFIFENQEQETSFTISGKFLEIIENKRLVYTWEWELDKISSEETKFKLTIDFEGHPEGSQINIVQESFSKEEAVYPHKEGWERGLNKLYNYLEKYKHEKNHATPSVENSFASDSKVSRDN
jgi:uncharacterized protein YndB with AHSA1/START domain